MAKKTHTQKKRSVSKKVLGELEEATLEETKRMETTLTEGKGNGLFLLFGLVALLVLISVLLLGVNYYMTQKAIDETSYDYLYQQTIDGHESDDNYLYNDYVFVHQDNTWLVKVDKVYKSENQTTILEKIPLYTHYGPKDLEHISISSNLKNVFENKNALRLAFNSSLGQYITLAGLEISKTFVSFYDWPQSALQLGLLEESTTQFPIYTCANATKNIGVIEFKTGNSTLVTAKNNCITVMGEDPEEMLKASDRLLFAIIGIMPIES